MKYIIVTYISEFNGDKEQRYVKLQKNEKDLNLFKDILFESKVNKKITPDSIIPVKVLSITGVYEQKTDSTYREWDSSEITKYIEKL